MSGWVIFGLVVLSFFCIAGALAYFGVVKTDPLDGIWAAEDDKLKTPRLEIRGTGVTPYSSVGGPETPGTPGTPGLIDRVAHKLTVNKIVYAYLYDPVTLRLIISREDGTVQRLVKVGPLPPAANNQSAFSKLDMSQYSGCMTMSDAVKNNPDINNLCIWLDKYKFKDWAKYHNPTTQSNIVWELGAHPHFPDYQTGMKNALSRTDVRAFEITNTGFIYFWTAMVPSTDVSLIESAAGSKIIIKRIK